MTKESISNSAEDLGYRTRIWAIHGMRPTLGTGSETPVGMIRFLTSLSRIADVFYNGMLFEPQSDFFGLSAREVIVPKEGYDLYCVSSNSDILAQVPHPKVMMGTPGDKRSLELADAVFVHTDAWRKGFLPYDPATSGYSARMVEWFGDSAVNVGRIINVQQSIDPLFQRTPNQQDVLEARMRLGSCRAIGYFGTVQQATFPRIFLAELKALMDSYPDVRLAICGTVEPPIDREILKLPRLPYGKMPALLQACIATVADEGDGASFLGSIKVMDSIARGVPVIAYKTSARVEQLGEEYPLYYENASECSRCIQAAIVDEDIRAEVTRHLNIRAAHFSPTAQAQRLKRLLGEVVHSCE